MAMVLGASMIAEDIETELNTPTFPDEIPVPEPTATTPEQAIVMPADERQTSNSPSIEIYDSGCTRHMTPD